MAAVTSTLPRRPTGNDIGEWQTYLRATFPVTDLIINDASVPSIDCANKPLIVRGSSLTVNATRCAPVLIDGNSNTVRLDNLLPGLTILGDGNRVIFQQGEASGISIAGNSNSVVRG
jgi:hypothetical protein